MTIVDAKRLIISHNTRPTQIDHTTSSERMDLRKAELFIDNLPENERVAVWKDLRHAIDSYYTSNILGTNGEYYSAAELNDMF